MCSKNVVEELPFWKYDVCELSFLSFFSFLSLFFLFLESVSERER